MANARTYILAPNFQYRPSGPIQIGNIIADPFRPTKALSCLPTDTPADVDTLLEYEHEITREKGRALGFNLFARFLQVVDGNVGTTVDKEMIHAFKIAQLETQRLRKEPQDDDADIARRLAEPKVRAAMKAGLFGRQPVYLITGVKIARGLEARTEINRTTGGSIGSTVPILQGAVSVGGDVKDERRHRLLSSFQSKDDVVFAYQVHIIKAKGRKRENVTADVFVSDAGFLHDDDMSAAELSSDERAEQNDGLLISAGTLENFESDEDQGMHSYESIDTDGTTCLCVAAEST